MELKNIIITIFVTVIGGLILKILEPIILSLLKHIYENYLFITLFLVILLILLAGIVKLIKYKMNKKEERSVLMEYITDTPLYIVNYIEYPEKKLKWGVRNREFCRWIIDNTPICPKCNNKLEEKQQCLWYEWTCNNPKCNYNTYRTWNHKTILMSKTENLIKNKKS